jgi:nucleoside-diphosphate-sugar epimerase
MSILVIGGHGYIGSRLCQHFIDKNTAHDIHGDRTQDYNLLTVEALSPYQYIVLLAGNSSVPSCQGDLKSPWNNNVRNFDNLVKKLRFDQKLIYASSSSVYGNSHEQVCQESDANMEYFNNYDLTKIVLDQVAEKYLHQGRQIVGLRLGTVNGASPVLRKELLVNSMTYRALYHDEILISNREILRPYLSIDDLTSAIYKIITDEFVPGFYNLANDNFKIWQYAVQVQKQLPVNIVDQGTNSGVYNFQIDSNKFCQTYDFEFQDNLESLISKLIDCYRDKKSRIVERTSYFNYQG